MNELSELLDVRGQTFASFDAGLFSETKSKQGDSPRANIQAVRDDCRRFCRNFGKAYQNIVFSGPPGTGKTFLAACAAGEISKLGFSVVYDTAARCIGTAEALRVGRGEDDRAIRRLTECDLLILDDLGAEFLTPLSQSVLHDIVNTRVLKKKQTLIATNLTSDGVRDRYSPALSSRLLGEFIWLWFHGEDLRSR
jgi:DNA replication protein DnaC